MADSSLSVEQCDISYLVVYQNWILNDRKRNNGESTIPITEILRNLRIGTLLNQDEYQIVIHEVTDGDKLLKLFSKIMPAKGKKGFDQLMKILLQNNCDELANALSAERARLLTDVSTAVQNPLTQIQTHLFCLLKKNVDFMAKYWSDVIPISQTEAAFVRVQVLQHFRSENGNPVGSYREVFDKDGKTIHEQILIQADPGCGKTTYVNKLALDWANEDEYLREKFDFVFLIALQTLTMNVFEAIKRFLPDQSKRWFESYAKSPDSKILLILDGFDELVDSSELYSFLMDILEGKSTQFQFFHLIVTTRRSHVDKIPQQFRQRSLLIKGFDEESMKQFLDKQHVPLPSVGQEFNLSHLLQTPLFCVIYCSLHFGGGDPIELEDSYDLIKALVENSVTNTETKKTVANVKWWWWLVNWLVENSVTNTVANVKEQLDEIGKFAFQMLDSWSLNFLKEFCRSEVIKPSFDLSRVNLDLLIKRLIPTRGVGGFKEEFSLPHQLIAEYLAARYFARSLTEKQLKQANASVLIFQMNEHYFFIPFVRFFFFELLFLYLEKKYKESVFANFLRICTIRFIWNMKSNKDIPTLDNVSHLNFDGWTGELVNHSRFLPTLSKCRNLSSLHLTALSKNQVEQVVNSINNCFQQRLIKLNLDFNENVASTPQLFTALSKCKHIAVLDLSDCKLTVESTTELARYIDNSGLVNLRRLYLTCNANVGSSTDLFRVLHKCPQLQQLCLCGCSMTEESLNIFLSTFNSNTFQQLDFIWLERNEEIKVDDNFFIALKKCPKISAVFLSEYMKSDLSEVGRKVKETLEQRGCRFRFD